MHHVQVIVGCTPINVPLWAIPIEALYYVVFMGYNPQEPPHTFNPESLQVLDVVRSRYRNRLLNKHSAAVEFFHREKIVPLQMSVS